MTTPQAQRSSRTIILTAAAVVIGIIVGWATCQHLARASGGIGDHEIARWALMVDAVVDTSSEPRADDEMRAIVMQLVRLQAMQVGAVHDTIRIPASREQAVAIARRIQESGIFDQPDSTEIDAHALIALRCMVDNASAPTGAVPACIEAAVLSQPEI